MNKRIKDKINEIEKYLGELEIIKPLIFEEYKNNFEKKAACERYFQKIIESVTDLASLIIKEKRFETPESENDFFKILTKTKMIDSILAEKLEHAKSMRNFIIHQYGKIDDLLVFASIDEELFEDVTKFLKIIKNEK